MEGQRRPLLAERSPDKRRRQTSPVPGPSNSPYPSIVASTTGPSSSSIHLQQANIEIKGNSEGLTSIYKPQVLFAIQPRILPIFTIPAAVSSFAGREEELKDMSKPLDQGQMLAVCGLAGIGKSELAKQYVHNNINKYRHLVWIEAETERSLNQCFRDLGKDLGRDYDKDTNMKRNVGNVYASLIEDDNITILIIFDNALHRRAINAYLPTRNLKRIHVVITSQTTQWGGSVHPLVLQPISEKAAMDVFRSALCDTEDQLQIESNTEDLQRLARHLSCMPLALQLVACYLRQETDGMNKDFSIANYLQELTKDDKVLQKQFTDDSENEYQNTIYKSLKITLDRIEKTAPDTVLRVVYVCAYLNADEIHELHLKFVSDDELPCALRVLKNYALISVERQCKRIRMHRLVQQVLRYHQEQRDTVARHLATAVHITLTSVYNSHLESVSEYVVQHENVVRRCYQQSQTFQSTITQHGESWLLEAAPRGYSKLVRFLVQDLGVSIHTQNVFNCTLLHLVSQCEDEVQTLECARLLIQLGATVSANNLWNNTVLHCAAEQGQLQPVRMFIEQLKCDLNLQNVSGRTPLHLVAQFEDKGKALECASLLLQHGASVNVRDEQGRTPLHWAAKYGHAQLVRMYIEEHKCDPNSQDKDGMTALHLVARSDNEDKALECARALVQLGASLHVKDQWGWAPLHQARQWQQLRLVPLLEQLESDVPLAPG